MSQWFENELVTQMIPECTAHFLQIYRTNRTITESDITASPRLQRYCQLRGFTPETLARWCAFQTINDNHSHDHDHSHNRSNACEPAPWAADACERTTIFGMSTEALVATIEKFKPDDCLRVADFGAGTGYRTCELGPRFPHMTIRGFEPACDMIHLAHINTMDLAPKNVFFEQAAAAEVAHRYPAHFDLAISIMCAHFSRDLHEHFLGIRHSLRRGGILTLREFLLPSTLTPQQREFSAELTARGIWMRHPPLCESSYRELLAQCGFRWLSAHTDRELTPTRRKQPSKRLNQHWHEERLRLMAQLARSMRINSEDAAAAVDQRLTVILEAL